MLDFYPDTTESLELESPEYCREVAEARMLYENPDFMTLKNIEHLALHNLYGDLANWMSQLLHILKTSPKLRVLSLSLGYETVIRLASVDQHELFSEYLDQICDGHAKGENSPLHLEALHLGTAIYPGDPDTLNKLTDLASLEEVSIRNEGVSDETDWVI